MRYAQMQEIYFHGIEETFGLSLKHFTSHLISISPPLENLLGDGYRRLVKVIGAIGNTFKDEWIIWAAYSIEAPGSCEEGAVTVPSNIILYQWDTVQNISSDIKKTSTVICVQLDVHVTL